MPSSNSFPHFENTFSKNAFATFATVRTRPKIMILGTEDKKLQAARRYPWSFTHLPYASRKTFPPGLNAVIYETTRLEGSNDPRVALLPSTRRRASSVCFRGRYEEKSAKDPLNGSSADLSRAFERISLWIVKNGSFDGQPNYFDDNFESRMRILFRILP